MAYEDRTVATGFLNKNAPAHQGPKAGQPLHPNAPLYKGFVEFDNDVTFKKGEKMEISAWIQTISREDKTPRLDFNKNKAMYLKAQTAYIPPEQPAEQQPAPEGNPPDDDDIPF